MSNAERERAEQARISASHLAALRELAEDLESIVQVVSSRDGDATARQHQRAEAVRAALAVLSSPPPPVAPNLRELVERIARLAHEGQKDTVTGVPYITHVERVVAAVETPDEKAVAWLHDVLEDSPLTALALRCAGVPEHIIAAVELLTRQEEPYAHYIDTIAQSGNALAMAVKLADLRDHLTPHCPERLRPRYEKALARLAEVSRG